MSHVKAIPVRDANGDQHTVYEFQDRRFLRKVRRWKLDNGEPVETVDNVTFLLRNGERMTRLD